MDVSLRLRSAEAGDLKDIAELYTKLDGEHSLLDVTLGQRDTKARRARVREALADQHARVTVVCDDDRIVGFVLASFCARRPDVIIEAIALLSAFRRRGMGTSLIRDVEAWAKGRNVRYVELDVYEFNPEARAFYESLGYLTASRKMRRDPNFEAKKLINR